MGDPRDRRTLRSRAIHLEADLFANPARLFPTEWTLHGYEAIWQELPFARLLANSFIFAGVTTLLLLLFDSMCAYALARMRFRGSTLLFWLVIATLMIPFQVTLIPVFIELFHFGWLDTYQGLIVPRATSAFGIFMLRQFFMNLWNDLLWPLIVTNSIDMRTLPAALTLFGGQHVTDHAVLLAGATISLVPLALAFFFAQKYFVQGIATTGLK